MRLKRTFTYSNLGIRLRGEQRLFARTSKIKTAAADVEAIVVLVELYPKSVRNSVFDLFTQLFREDQAGLSQNLQVLGDTRLGDTQALTQFRYRHFL